MKRLMLILSIAMLCSACSVSKKTGCRSIANDGKVWASLWQQRSAEYRALCFQAYNAAHAELDVIIRQPSQKPYAIITDIDETVLDNSPYDIQRAILNQEYDSASWKAWTAKSECDTVAGAPSFFKYAASKGVQVFYITNRDEDERIGTLRNLQRYMLPNADNEHLFLKKGNSSKESRRLQVAEKYNIALLCGDNLPDFDAVYDNHPTEINREEATTAKHDLFGHRYIVLPNASYGDFENSLFKYNFKLNSAQKDSVIKAVLRINKP